MTAAELRQGGGIYELTWPDEKILIRADRLYEDSKYNTFAEITVRSTIPGLPQHIHQARLNLVSTTTRRSFIKELEQRVGDMPWGLIVEELAIRVLRAHREGEPFVQLSNYAPDEALSHRLSPLLREGQATVFYGQGETGKSFVSLFLGLLVAEGKEALGFTPEPGGVLYLDYETGQDEIWDRVNLITAGLDIAIPDRFFYRYMTQSVAADIETIQRFVLENSINLVVVDSAAPASIEPETSAGATAYFQALRSLHCTTLTVAHTEASGKQDRPFGSIFWRNLPRANFRFRAATEVGHGEVVVGIKQTKSNNSRRMRDFGLALKFAEDAVTVSKANLQDVEELADTLSLRERIEHALAREAKTSAELAEELGASPQQVRNTLSRGKDRSFVMVGTNLGTPKWGLLQPSEP